MERFCSYIGAAVKSRKRPYENIARRIRDVAQLRVIRDLYQLDGQMSFGDLDLPDEEESETIADRLPDCKSNIGLCFKR